MRLLTPSLLRPVVALVAVVFALPAFAHGNASTHFARAKCPQGEHYQGMGKGSMRTGSCVAN